MPISASSSGAEREPDDGADQAAHDVLAGAQRVGAQDRQRAEHHPERVLHAGQVGDEDRDAQPGRAAHAVVQPDRMPVDVRGRALLCRRQRPGQALAAGARAAVSTQLRRSAAAVSSMFAAICETAKASSCARKLGSSEVTSSLIRSSSASSTPSCRRPGRSTVALRSSVSSASAARPARRRARRHRRPIRRAGLHRARAPRPRAT